jgi:hypothetical protein
MSQPGHWKHGRNCYINHACRCAVCREGWATYMRERRRKMGGRSRFDDKTPSQLRREIAYYAQILTRTKSQDRLNRAHTAIRLREAALARALTIQMVVEAKS